MGHKLCDEYRGVGYRKVECDDRAFVGKVLAFRQRYFRPAMKLPVHRHLLASYARVRIDMDGAYEAILGMPSFGPNGGDVREASRLLGEAINDIAHTDRRQLDFTYCRMGRVHHLVSRLPKCLRPYLTIDGEPLWNIDITASQPTLLSLAIIQYRADGNRLTNPKAFNRGTLPRNPYHHPPTQPPTPPHPQTSGTTTSTILDEPITELTDQPAFTSCPSALACDEQKYIALCEQGRIYEHMMDRLESDGFAVTRGQIKEQFYTLYYDKVRSIEKLKDPLAKAFATTFAAEFPGVLAVIRAVKKRAGYRYLACWMQNMESSLVIGTVCERLRCEYPQIPLLTIHDSIATTLEYADLVRRILLDELHRRGVQPRVGQPDPWA